jgi:hypothetical protein
MAMIQCPECDREVSEQAMMCPHCGYPLRAIGVYEYRSEREVFGLPLVHIVSGRGMDLATGRIRVAKGIIAIGPVAVGGFAFGGVSLGLVSFGGLALGLIALGGGAIGVLLAGGGLAIGAVAIGGGAMGYYAFGGGVLGVHAFGGNARDPNTLELLRKWFGNGFGRW